MFTANCGKHSNKTQRTKCTISKEQRGQKEEAEEAKQLPENSKCENKHTEKRYKVISARGTQALT